MRRIAWRDQITWLLLAITAAICFMAVVSTAYGGASSRVFNLAGTGSSGFSGDGGPAISARLTRPTSVAIRPDGSIVIADQGNYRVRQVDPQGRVSTIAGNGAIGVPADGSSIGNPIGTPLSVAVGPDGADLVGLLGAIVAIRDGQVRRVVGSGLPGEGNDGPALATTVNNVAGLAVGPSGDVVFSESGNSRVRRLSPDGAVSTIAGSGTWGYGGDGGSARSARLASPNGIAVAQDGAILVADTDNGRVRSISTGGTIETVAGGGTKDPSEGVRALGIDLGSPAGIASTRTGELIISDRDSNRLIAVRAGVVAWTTETNPRCEIDLSGESIAAARFCQPEGVAVTPAGGVVVADASNDAVRYLNRTCAEFPFRPTLVGSILKPRKQGRRLRFTVRASARSVGHVSVRTGRSGRWMNLGRVKAGPKSREYSMRPSGSGRRSKRMTLRVVFTTRSETSTATKAVKQ